MTSLGVATVLVLILAGALVIGLTGSRRERVITPLVLLVAIELAAVWPPLVPGVLDGDIVTDYWSLLFAATALLVFVATYCIVGGNRVSVAHWRSDEFVPEARTLGQLWRGIVLWVAILVAIDIYRFQGPPLLLTQGLGAIIDPVSNPDQVGSIRDARLQLTKAHLVGEAAYAGQGVLNTLTKAGWQIAAVSTVLWASWDKTRAAYVRAGAVVLIAFVFMASTGVRAPILVALVGVISVLVIRFRPTVRQVALSAVASVVVLLFIMPLGKGERAGSDLGSRYTAAVERVSQGNGQNNAHIVRLVDAGSLEPMYGGLFIERFAVMIPGPDAGEPFGLRLTRLAYGADSNTTGFSTPTQFGLLYAEGGPWMVLFGYGLSGLLLAVIWARLARISQWYGPLVLAQGGFALAYISVTGVHGLMTSAGVLVAAILVIQLPLMSAKVADRRPAANLDSSKFGRTAKNGNP